MPSSEAIKMNSTVPTIACSIPPFSGCIWLGILKNCALIDELPDLIT